MSEHFADTCYLFALLSKQDQHHSAAAALEDSLSDSDQVHTSEEVLMELLNFTSKRGEHLRKATVEFVNSLRDRSDVVVYELDPERFQKALEKYEKFSDKDWSLVDCSSIVLIEEFDINGAVFTHDHHFKQAGFDIAF